jgi:hypothetical protein
MAELHHIIGAILRDISQARFTSDLYSRNVSRYYEQDPLLRRFPVPRSEIEEVDIDIKFAVLDVSPEQSRTESREASMATIFERASVAMAQHFMDAVKEAIRGNTKITDQTKKTVDFKSTRIYVHQDILNYFLINQGHIIKEGKLDQETTIKDLKQLLGKSLRNYILNDSPELFEGQPPDIESIQEKVIEKINIEKYVQSMQQATEAAIKEEGDYRVQVDVTLDKLHALPETIISSIKIKTATQNYLWTKVDHEGREWYTLRPE